MDRIGKDIVARLRVEVDPSTYEYEFARRGEREEAAAEIERLRKLAKEQGQEIAITRERDERLEAALMKIRTMQGNPIEIARAALTTTEGR